MTQQTPARVGIMRDEFEEGEARAIVPCQQFATYGESPFELVQALKAIADNWTSRAIYCVSYGPAPAPFVEIDLEELEAL